MITDSPGDLPAWHARKSNFCQRLYKGVAKPTIANSTADSSCSRTLRIDVAISPF